MGNTIEILVPTADPKIKKLPLNPTVPDLNGKVLGFLWDEKPNGDLFLQRIRDRLTKKLNLAGSIWKQVEAFHIPVEEAPEVKQLAATADAVIIAIGD